MQNSDSPPQILLLCENEQSVQLERRALREAGYAAVKMMTSGIEAAKLVAGITKTETAPDIIICLQNLGDMDSEQFCGIIRSHPLLESFPILVILPNASEAEQLEAMNCGASALLARPYSVEQLKKQLGILGDAVIPFAKLRETAKAVNTSAFDSALASYGVLLRPDRKPDDYFRIGLRFLESKHWNYAISAFQRAMRDERIKAEAQLGMAAACKGKGDLAHFRAWLGSAAETFVQAKRWQRARASYARLLQHDLKAKNPFIAEAHRLIRIQKYDEAATVLAQGLSLIPKGQASGKFAQICFSAYDPQAMLKALGQVLAQEKALAPELLNAEIARNLDALEHERLERQRQQAAERKWELARRKKAEQNAAREEAAREKSSAENFPDTKPELREEKAAPLLDNDFPDDNEYLPEDAFDGYVESDLTDQDMDMASAPVLEPLTRDDATSGMFEKKPGVNEFLSVVKLTWKLAKRSRKKK